MENKNEIAVLPISQEAPLPKVEQSIENPSQETPVVPQGTSAKIEPIPVLPISQEAPLPPKVEQSIENPSPEKPLIPQETSEIEDDPSKDKKDKKSLLTRTTRVINFIRAGVQLVSACINVVEDIAEAGACGLGEEEDF